MPKSRDTSITPLTDTNKLTLPPGIYNDPRKLGLQLRVSPKGRRVWNAHIHSPSHGETIDKKLGPAPDIKIKSARLMLDKLRLEHASGVKVAAGIPTFHQAVQSYNKPWVTNCFNLYFADWLGTRLDKLTIEMVEMREQRIKADAGHESRERDKRAGKAERDDAGMAAVSSAAKALCAVFNHAKKREQYLGANMGLKMTIAEDKPRQRWMTDEEHARFLDVLENAGRHGLQPWTRNYYRILLATGSRRTALLKARWEHIQIREKVWTIPSRDAKNRTPNHVQLGPTAIKLLEEQRKAVGDSPWVFPSVQRDPMLHHMTFSWVEWERVRDAAKLTRFTPHDVRRTFGSMLVSRGAPMKVVSVAMNHKHVSTTESTYGHIAPKAIHDALELLE